MADTKPRGDTPTQVLTDADLACVASRMASAAARIHSALELVKDASQHADGDGQKLLFGAEAILGHAGLIVDRLAADLDGPCRIGDDEDWLPDIGPRLELVRTG